MSDREQFVLRMQELVEKGRANNGIVTAEDVKICFEGISLNAETLPLLTRYLESQHIAVEDESALRNEVGSAGASRRKTPSEVLKSLPNEEAVMVNYFLADVRRVPKFAAGEEQELIDRMDDDMEAKNRLAEGHLNLVWKAASGYVGRGLPAGDLLQEGSMALLIALEDYSPMDGRLDRYLSRRIALGIEAALEEHQAGEQTGHNLAGEANRLMDLSARLAEENEQEVSREELAKAAGLPVERVEELMAMYLKALE